MDEVLANDVAQGFCQLLQAQTSQERSTIKTLGSYLKFREIDVGRPYVLSLLFIFGYNCRVLTAILDSTQLSLDSVPSSISLPPNSKSPPLWKAPHFAMSVLWMIYIAGSENGKYTRRTQPMVPGHSPPSTFLPTRQDCRMQHASAWCIATVGNWNSLSSNPLMKFDTTAWEAWHMNSRCTSRAWNTLCAALSYGVSGLHDIDNEASYFPAQVYLNAGSTSNPWPFASICMNICLNKGLTELYIISDYVSRRISKKHIESHRITIYSTTKWTSWFYSHLYHSN